MATTVTITGVIKLVKKVDINVILLKKLIAFANTLSFVFKGVNSTVTQLGPVCIDFMTPAVA